MAHYELIDIICDKLSVTLTDNQKYALVIATVLSIKDAHVSVGGDDIEIVIILNKIVNALIDLEIIYWNGEHFIW